jgi:hypothetical protein
MKIGVVSINKTISHPGSKNFDKLYGEIGMNTGNLIFTNAVYKQIEGVLSWVGFYFDPTEVNKNYDALIIPAANWINEEMDWSWLIDILEKVEIPIITIGIGIQANSLDVNNIKASESSIRLVKLLASKSKYISCRGDFTRDWLRSIGILNVVTTGCPSTYMRLNPKENNYIDKGNIILQGTRYWTSREFIDKNTSNRHIFALAGKYNISMIYQSEPEEIDYLVNYSTGKDTLARKEMTLLAELYGLASEKDMKIYLENKGKVFFDPDQWSSYVQQNIGVIGTRLHGTIVTLNSNRPARLIVHDSRTQEICEFSGIPTLSESLLMSANESELYNIINDTDLTKYFERKKFGSVVYEQFLTACGLQPNNDEIISN